VTPSVHICFIADPGSVHIRRWVRFFYDAGYEVSVISYNRVSGAVRATWDMGAVYDLTRWFDGGGRPVLRRLRYGAWAGKIRQLIRQIDPDLVHAHNVAGAGWLGLFSGFHPFVVTAHGSDMMLMAQRPWLYRYLNARVLQAADRVTAGSWALYDRCRIHGAGAPKTQCLLLGTDTVVFGREKTRDRARTILNLGPGPLVFFIRSMHGIYNPDVMTTALSGIRKTLPKVRCVFPAGNGDPALLAAHSARVRDLGLDGSVIYLDPVKDDRQMALWYTAADVCVSIPSSDGVSIAVLEAMACRKPVVMTDLPAYRELFHHGRHVVKLAVTDAGALAEAVVHLFTVREDKAAMGQRARDVVCRYADHSLSMQRMDKLYKHLVSSCRGK
jgi:L-malate glycosyltransferase